VPLIDEDDIPGKGAPSAATVEEAALLNSIGEFFEAATAVADAPAAGGAAAIGGTVRKAKEGARLGGSAIKKGRIAAQRAREARRARRARRKAERALKKLEQSKAVLTNPAVARAARKLMQMRLGDHAILRALWAKAQQVKSVADFARTTQNTPFARFRARLAFKSQLRRFWEEVASPSNKEARKLFKEAGFVFEGPPGTAPVFPGLPEKVGRLSVDHVARIKDDPFKALDADNLRFVTQEENTFLEVLKANIRKVEQKFGGTFE